MYKTQNYCSVQRLCNEWMCIFVCVFVCFCVYNCENTAAVVLENGVEFFSFDSGVCHVFNFVFI